MIKATLLYFILSVLASTSFAKTTVECTIAQEPESSTMTIEYSEDKASKIYLRSPGSDENRLQNLSISHIDRNSFSAKPTFEGQIDWEMEPNCFKNIGTQMYFVLDFDTESFGVYLAPMFVLKDKTCVSPRARPQPKALICSILN